MNKKLVEILKEKKITHIVGAYDALSAKIIEKMDYPVIWGSGFCVSASHAKPDANIIGSDTMIQSYSLMAKAVNIPVIADCDTGYGNIHNVINTVIELEQAGIKGMSIEDKKFPKLNSLFPNEKNSLESISEFSSKIQAASQTKKTDDFCVIARTESIIQNCSNREILARISSYIEAGADAIILHSDKYHVDKLFEIIDQYDNKIPLIIIPTDFSNVNFEKITKHNVYNIVVANQLIRASVYGIKRFLNQLKNANNIMECQKEIVDMKEIFELQNMKKYMSDENKYSY